MADVLADLETKLTDSRNALAPLVAVEASALAAAANATKARVGQDIQIAAIEAAHLAARAALLGEAAVAKVEASPYRKWIEISSVVVLLGALIGVYFFLHH